MYYIDRNKAKCVKTDYIKVCMRLCASGRDAGVLAEHATEPGAYSHIQPV